MDELFETFARPGVPGVSARVIEAGEAIFTQAYGLADLSQAIAGADLPGGT